MIPSNSWFPGSLQERAAWFVTFQTNFNVIGTSLGFGTADKTAVNADTQAMQYLALTAGAVDAFSKAMTAYRSLMTEGVNGGPAATLPVVPDLGTEPTALPGIFERLDDLVKRIRSAPGYSKDDGEQLGIVPKSPVGKDSLADDSPVIKAKVKPGNVVEVSFVRGVSDGIVVETRLDNDLEWKDSGMFIKSPGEIFVPVLNGNLPRAVQLRARFLNGNNTVGLNSDVVNVVTIP